MNEQFYFPGITLLITHYNRSKSLERLLNRVRDLGCRFDDIVVSDDGSRPEHLEKLNFLKQEYNFQLITSPVNKGFANCINKGQDAVKTPYTLYIQEDFEIADQFPPHLVDALEIMNKNKDIDYIRFWSFYRFPTLKPFGKGFSETIYNPWNLNHLNFFMYSDNPHIRRSNFLEKFGRYQEGIDGNISEHNMSIRYIQKKGKGLFYDDYSTLFEHKNSTDEPSSFNRASWRQSKKPLFVFMRALYLKYKWLKCLWEVKFMR